MPVTRAEVSFPAPKAPEVCTLVLLTTAEVSMYLPMPTGCCVQGVTVPKSQPEVAPARFGFVDNAERINSRACMVCRDLLLRAFNHGLSPGAKALPQRTAVWNPRSLCVYWTGASLCSFC